MTTSQSLLNFACGMIGFRYDGPNPPPEGWAVRRLILDGAIGYLHSEDDSEGFYKASPGGYVDRYGRPLSLNLSTETGSQFTVSCGTGNREASYIRASVDGSPLENQITRFALAIDECNKSLMVNLRNSRRAPLIYGEGTNLEKLRRVLRDLVEGNPTAIEGDIGASISKLDLSAEFISRDLWDLMLDINKEALRRFGGVAPPQYKAERVQSAEVSAAVAESIDSVYLMIDVANADMKAGNVPGEFFYRGYGVAYDVDTPTEEGEKENA